MKITKPFHPYLFALYAVIGIFQINANDIPPEQVIRPVLFLLAISVIVNYLLFLSFKDGHRAALITSLLIFWGIYFGHVYRFLSNYQWFRDIPESRTFALIVWTILIGLFGLPQVWSAFKDKTLFTKALNISAVALLAIPVVVLSLVVRETIVQKEFIEARLTSQEIEFDSGKDTDPDIYYIIVDGYGRQDILSKYGYFDNSDFMDYLGDKGFYVAEKSQTNYMMTHLSLSSSLNFEYLDDLEGAFKNSANRGPYSYMIANNRLMEYLSNRGYETVNIESVAMFVRLRNSDIYMAHSASKLNELEALLLTTSVADRGIEHFFPEVPLVNYETHRNILQYQFEALEQTVDIDQKKIVFAHIWAPHPPFVFDEEGTPLTPDRPYFGGDANAFFGSSDEYLSGYSKETVFINMQLKSVINTILENTQRPTVIIIQGDHGPGLHTSFVNVEESCFDERFSILNAYYFSDQDYSVLSPDITPVNSFRMVLNKYFDTDLDVLDNRHYYVTWLRPYQFIDVTGKTNQCSMQ